MALRDAYDDDADADAEEASQEEPISKRSRGVALALCAFAGFFGLHRFYVEKPKTALAMLFTLGGCGIWYLYDLVLLAVGEFRDSDDLPLRNWGVSASSFEQHRLVGRAEQRVNELEEQFDGLRQQFNDLAERVDFAERMLAQHREAPKPQLPRGS
jgi:TM2 domain